MHAHDTAETPATHGETYGANPKMSCLSDATLALIEQARTDAREFVHPVAD
jgi:hypothetical protein